MSQPAPEAAEPPVLPESVPVTMPDLPARLVVNTAQQFKAVSDPTRSKIIAIIQQRPATAKQIADRLGMAPGTIGHHLQVLEAVGLAKVGARRLVHGIVAKYYVRTARLFFFDLPPDATRGESVALQLISEARDELAEMLAERGDDQAVAQAGFPHARLSQERILAYRAQLEALIEAFVNEPPDPAGMVVGLSVALFAAPRYVQIADTPDD